MSNKGATFSLPLPRGPPQPVLRDLLSPSSKTSRRAAGRSTAVQVFFMWQLCFACCCLTPLKLHEPVSSEVHAVCRALLFRDLTCSFWATWPKLLRLQLLSLLHASCYILLPQLGCISCCAHREAVGSSGWPGE